MKRKIDVTKATALRVTGIEGFFKKEVTKFGTGAKIDCPKEYLGKTVYVAVCAE
jgi:putative transposon-encoded protein